MPLSLKDINVYKYLYVRGSSYSQCDTLAVHYVGFKAQDCKHHQGGQHGGEEVDKRHQDSVEVAVVVPLVVAGEGDDAPEAEAQGEEDLRGRLSPHLGLQHDLQLKNTIREDMAQFGITEAK